MSTIRILSISGAVFYESEAPNVRAALVEAVAQRVVLGGADLRGADLGNRRVLQIAGSRDWIVVIQTPESVEVSIGCCRHDLPHWLERYQGIGLEYGYTPEQIAEYGAHLRHVEAWVRMAPVPIAEPAQTGEVAP
jgi:hypothetical protein